MEQPLYQPLYGGDVDAGMGFRIFIAIFFDTINTADGLAFYLVIFEGICRLLCQLLPGYKISDAAGPFMLNQPVHQGNSCTRLPGPRCHSQQDTVLMLADGLFNFLDS